MAFAPNSLTVRTTEPSGEISWHVEQAGDGPDVVLIPSGEGDCGSFGSVMEDLAREFRVTTFDTPGFSRTTTTGKAEISMIALGRQVAALLDELGLKDATIYGCSSAGLALIDIVANHSHILHRAVIHEAALPGDADRDSPLAAMAALDDAGVSAACANLFENMLNEDSAAWRALGDDFHHRLSRNYVTWVRRYVAAPDHPPVDPASIGGAPITWTIGALFEVHLFFSNVRLAQQAGIPIEILPCRHFPQVSIPRLLADHIRTAARSSRRIEHREN